MIGFAWNVTLALTWSALTGHLSVGNLAIGFVIGYLVLWWLAPAPDLQGYVRRLPRVLGFAGFYAKEVIGGALRVAWDVITPTAHRHTGIVAVPLDIRGDVGVTVLANVISFTPGTLSIDVTPDGRYLLVHAMFIDDVEAFKVKLKHDMERRVMEGLR